MSILQRYILKEHIGPFCFGLFVIMFVLIMDLMRQMINLVVGKSVATLTVLELFAHNLAWMIALAVPMAILIATLMAFGRLSSDNEITALRASGISLYRLSMPILVVSALIAVLLVIFNDRILPESNLRVRNLYYAIRRQKPALALKDREGMFINDFDGYSILIERVDERRGKVYGVTIYELQDGKLPIPIRAESGRLAVSEDGDRLTLTLYNGEMHQIDDSDPDNYLRTKFRKHVIHITGIGQKLDRKGSSYRGDREMTIAMMREKIQGYQEDIRARRDRLNAIARPYIDHHFPKYTDQGYALPEGVVSRRALSPGSLIAITHRTIKDLQAEMHVIVSRRKMVNKYLVEIHKKHSIPVACIVFVLIGIPLGIMGRRSGVAVAIGMSISFFLLYWAFLIGGEELADRLLVPAGVAMWAPNVVIGAMGIVLILRSIREGTVIHWEYVGSLLSRWAKRKPVVVETETAS